MLTFMRKQAKIQHMNTFDESTLPADLEADTQAMMESLTTGKPLDPDILRRIRERGERIRQKIYAEHGVLDIGVPAIRALRDGDEA